MAAVAGLARHPHAAAFAAARFADQSALVLAGDGRRMDLNKLAVAIACPGLIAARGRPAGADDRHGRFAKDQAVAAGSYDHRIAAKGANLHRAHVLRDNSHALWAGPGVVDHWPKKFPEFILINSPLGLPAPHLLIQRIQKLLAL